MKKLLIITPHLSTGGAPEVTANKIKLLKDNFEIRVVEHSFLSWNFVVQRNKIINMIGDSNFHSLADNKSENLKSIIIDFKPDIISMEEFPEMFLSNESSEWIYNPDRNYKIIETTHDSSFNPAHKNYMPDSFIFVSAYNSLKYKHLDIPQHIIEYPVDKMNRDNKDDLRNKLGFEPDYKHVVIIGLFTQRKNQKYAFQICQKLYKYKIKFHFLGNQAENFADYWKPLMDWKEEDEKLNNCVIWGEVDNTEDFIRASDLFLFPSKGDRGNKELNPIVIKEALKYDDLPKLIFNLDVYLNKYNKTPNLFYLSGNIDSDSDLVLNITKAKSINNEDDIIVIGTYPNLKSRVQLTKDTIQSFKSCGRKILLISHFPVDVDTQMMADFYIYDKDNMLCHHSYYTRFFRTTDDYHAEININGLKNSNQSLAVLTNIIMASKFAKANGFKNIFYSTYDVVLNKSDFSVIEDGFMHLSDKNAFLGTLDTPLGKGIQTNGMFFRTDFLLDNLDDVRDAEEYNKACINCKSQNFLEDYLMKKFETKNDVLFINNREGTLLLNSGLGEASNSEYYSILPIKNMPNKYMFYFYTYNIDDRFISVKISKGKDDLYYNKFKISESREYKKEIEYDGNSIDIVIDFYDDDNLYKSERYSINEKSLAKHQNNGYFEWLKTNYKVKIVHLQTTLQDSKEIKSREQISKLRDYGFEYINHLNKPYEDLPPKFNCRRPECVSLRLFNEQEVISFGTALTPPHFGCFEAFKNAILSEFDDTDFLMICEGDCLIETDLKLFSDKVKEACKIMINHNIGYFSFGDTKTLEHGWPQSPLIENVPDQNLLYITNHIIGIQCIMFPSKIKAWLKNEFRTKPWDAADIFLNDIFRQSPYKMGIVKDRLTTQADGYSLIDKQDKKFK